MPKYIAFLRAINVGGRTVKMDRLRGLFADLGFSDVATYIASGNVIFDSPEKNAQRLEKKIEAALQEGLGYQVDTFLRTAEELVAVADYQPFADDEIEAHGLYIAFLGTPPSSQAVEKLVSTYTTEVDAFHVHDREVYWLCRKKMSDSKFSGGHLEKTLAMPATMRNVTTVRKLAAKYGGG